MDKISIVRPLRGRRSGAMVSCYKAVMPPASIFWILKKYFNESDIIGLL